MGVVRCRRLIVVLFELGSIVFANYAAFWLRFDGDITPFYFTLFARTLPLVTAVRALVFVSFRLDQGLWRYTSLWDLRKIAVAVAISTVVTYAIVDRTAGAGY